MIIYTTMQHDYTGVMQQRAFVTLDQPSRVDAQLHPGQIRTEVELTGALPALVTDRAEVSSSLSTMQVQNLSVLNLEKQLHRIVQTQLQEPPKEYDLKKQSAYADNGNPPTLHW